ncbi:ISAs1 family transposase [Mesorhizobium sp. M0320]|uniref:ISAs1 family transposase n=1 Tax=Mesorhizobium sp. M0320 TaxID=2956936 RepID=UPI00333C9E87
MPRHSSRSLLILDRLSALSDQRQQWNVIYRLPETLLLVLCATLCDKEVFVETWLWGRKRLDFLRRFLPYGRGIPAHNTLNGVINKLDADLFKASFTNWVETLREDAPRHRHYRRQHVAAQPCAWARRRATAHGLAWAVRQRLVLGQEATDCRNTHPAAAGMPRTYRCIGFNRRHGTQTEIAKTIVRRGGDYFLAQANWAAPFAEVEPAAAAYGDRRPRPGPPRTPPQCLSRHRLAVLGSPLRRQTTLFFHIWP